jgi:hypothetical protein
LQKHFLSEQLTTTSIAQSTIKMADENTHKDKDASPAGATKTGRADGDEEKEDRDNEGDGAEEFDFSTLRPLYKLCRVKRDGPDEEEADEDPLCFIVSHDVAKCIQDVMVGIEDVEATQEIMSDKLTAHIEETKNLMSQFRANLGNWMLCYEENDKSENIRLMRICRQYHWRVEHTFDCVMEEKQRLATETAVAET